MSFGTVISSVLAVVLSLGLVLALAWGALWLLRRFQDRALGPGRTRDDGRVIRFVRALPVGPRERVVLVEVGGEELLLGVTANSITELRHWPAPPPQSDAIGEVAVSGRERPRFRLPVADMDRGG